MSGYSRFCSSLLFPLHERLKGHDSVRVRRAMEHSQWLSPAAIQALQLQRLRQFLQAIEQQVPYYQALFAAQRFDSDRVQSINDLAALPLLDKAQIRAHHPRMRAANAQQLRPMATGGSSGEPLQFWLDKERISHDVAAKWRATRWWGVDIGDREAVVWGSPIELGAQDWLRYCRDRLFRSQLFPAFAMSPKQLEHWISRLRRQAPAMLFGYPSALSQLAGFAQTHGQLLSDLGIKVVFVTGERLYPHQRQLLETVFGCRVANGYGGRDAGFVAHECPAGQLHITAEDCVVEVVNAAGEVLPTGQLGELVVTHLASRAFPFLRYRTGDLGRLSPADCRCGRGLPVLEAVEGRSTDFVVAEDGTLLHGLALIYVLRALEGIAAFKIIQHSRLCTEVQVVTDVGYQTSTASRIRQQFQQRLGAGVAVEVVVLPAIAAEASGKFRYVVSHVEH